MEKRTMHKLRTKLCIEKNIFTGGYDVVLRIGSLELKEEAMDLATVVLLQQMPGFDPADIIPMEPPTNRTLH